MEIIKNEDSKKAVLILPDLMDFVANEKLKETVFNLFEDGYYTLELDFANVSTLSSLALGRLITFQKKAKENNGEISIINIKEDSYYKRMLDIIKFETVIKYSSYTL